MKVCIANGFHAVSCAVFKEMGAALASATNALMAVSAFAKKLPMLGKGKSTPPASPKTEAAPTLDALLD